MKRFFRPSILALLSAALVVGAAVLVFQGGPALPGPVPLPVAEGDQEIVWLYPATNTAAWERFVAALRRFGDPIGPEAFPAQTTATPEVTLSLPGQGGRLIFRWYKLTSDWKTRDWVEALLKRDPPPLAIIGGSSSDVARELACHLNQASKGLPEASRPLLLLTTATADRVPDCDEAVSDPSHRPTPDPPPAEGDDSPGVRFSHLYPERTFRFCFTNQQMANAVMNFIWSQNDLRPDTDPVHVVMWNDDSYSRDLVGGFWKALRPVVTRTTVTDWAWVTGIAASGAFPPYAGGGPLPVHRLGEGGSDFQMAPAKPYLIDSSVGTFDLPNRYEAERARELAREMLVKHQRRPLLVVTGQSQPCRRFLRALNRNAPGLALDRDVKHSGRRIVVATGDAIAFNTVYRDRQVAWPIQDLPFDFVFFCHHNPIDQAAGFQPEDAAAPGNEEGYTATTGTEDVLLYADIIEALVQAIASKEGPCPGPKELSQRLAGARLIDGRIGFGTEGVPLFTVNGNRHGGTGEHVVCLRPHFTRERVLPEADIEVWAWRSDLNGSRSWHRYDTPLPVYYGDAPVKGGGANGRD